MSAPTLNDFFAGRISHRTSSVCHAIEWGTAYIGTATEDTYRFEGVSASLISSIPGSGNYTDAAGNQFTVSFVNSLTMSSTNPPHVETSNTVTISKRSIHLYDIEIVHYSCTSGV